MHFPIISHGLIAVPNKMTFHSFFIFFIGVGVWGYECMSDQTEDDQNDFYWRYFVVLFFSFSHFLEVRAAKRRKKKKYYAVHGKRDGRQR